MYICMYIYIQCSRQDFCERSGMSNRSRCRSLHTCATGAQRRPYLGGSGGMPPRKNFKVLDATGWILSCLININFKKPPNLFHLNTVFHILQKHVQLIIFWRFNFNQI